MEDRVSSPEETTASLVSIEDLSLEQTQVAEQLYYSAGLDPVVDAGLKDHDRRIQVENKLINKVLGTRGSDIRDYGEAVAKRVALAVYTQLNRQYGGRVGDLRSYIMTLEEERDRSNTKYDELMGRVIGILGDEYKDLRTDSTAFVEKLTTVLGEDLEASRIDQKELTERLADIDGLRAQITALASEKEQLAREHESRTAAQKSGHDREIGDLKSQLAALERDKDQLKAAHESQLSALEAKHSQELDGLRSQIATLDAEKKAVESERAALQDETARLREDYGQLKAAMTTMARDMPDEEMGKRRAEELYDFLLKDSKVPDMVLEGVGKFLDFRKYLGVAVEKGVGEACRRMEAALSAAPDPPSTSQSRQASPRRRRGTRQASEG